MEKGLKQKSDLELITTMILVGIVVVFGYVAVRFALARIQERREMNVVVVSCEPTYEYYTVTVETDAGEQWAYFDDEYKGIGTELIVGMNGKDEITEVKGEN